MNKIKQPQALEAIKHSFDENSKLIDVVKHAYNNHSDQFKIGPKHGPRGGQLITAVKCLPYKLVDSCELTVKNFLKLFADEHGQLIERRFKFERHYLNISGKHKKVVITNTNIGPLLVGILQKILVGYGLVNRPQINGAANIQSETGKDISSTIS